MTHAIRSYLIVDPDRILQARDEHRRMITALREHQRDELVRLCVEHIQPSKRAYLAQMVWDGARSTG